MTEHDEKWRLNKKTARTFSDEMQYTPDFRGRIDRHRGRQRDVRELPNVVVYLGVRQYAQFVFGPYFAEKERRYSGSYRSFICRHSLAYQSTPPLRTRDAAALIPTPPDQSRSEISEVRPS